MVVRFRNAAMIAVGELIVVGGEQAYHILSAFYACRGSSRPDCRLEGGYEFAHSCKKNTFTIDHYCYWGILCICPGFGMYWVLGYHSSG